jgi:hypothetical protein
MVQEGIFHSTHIRHTAPSRFSTCEGSGRPRIEVPGAKYSRTATANVADCAT